VACAVVVIAVSFLVMVVRSSWLLLVLQAREH